MEFNQIRARLQPHTIKIYDLENCGFEVTSVPAIKLLDVSRFDLFAKLYYIEQKESGHVSDAEYVYFDHIKAFNPDLKEPGRDDKNSLGDFQTAFDKLINTFRCEEYDSKISIIPVSENGIILDGAHRVAAAAYFGKEVTIARFRGVFPKCAFDYQYFMNRGLHWEVADIIAYTMTRWVAGLHIACFWPRIGNEGKKRKGVLLLNSHYPFAYEKRVSVSLKSFYTIIGSIYSAQDWTKDIRSVESKALECYGRSKEIHCVLFKCEDLQQVLYDKNEIRRMYECGNHSIHISDSDSEASDIANLFFIEDGIKEWKSDSIYTIREKIREKYLYFKGVSWLNFKIKIASYIRRTEK